MATQPSAAESLRTRRARIDLAAAHRWAVRDGLSEGTWNHFSLVHPEDASRLLITPANTHWSHVTASSIEEVGPDYDRESGSEMAWVAYRIHYPLHDARPDAACALHVHSPYVTALSALEDCTLRMVTQTSLGFFGRVAYTDELDALSEGELRQGELRQGELRQGEIIAQALGERCTILIMRHHGALVVGPTVADAYTDTYNLERCAQTQLLAQGSGQRLREIPAERLSACSWVGADPSRDWEANRLHFEALERVLDADEPSYRE
jgi:ribulose-5-phosphate 4-epimerase/fuculose-1-phosphate aldolase